MFADEGTSGITGRQQLAFVEHEAKRRYMRPERVVRPKRRGDEIRPLLFYARIDVLPVVAVRPTIKAAVLHGREKVGDEVVAELVALVDDRP